MVNVVICYHPQICFALLVAVRLQLVSSYLHKESRVSSKEVLLNAFEHLTVTVNFSPSAVGSIDAILRVRLIGTDMRHSVSIIPYAMSSKPVWILLLC